MSIFCLLAICTLQKKLGIFFIHIKLNKIFIEIDKKLKCEYNTIARAFFIKARKKLVLSKFIHSGFEMDFIVSTKCVHRQMDNILVFIIGFLV